MAKTEAIADIIPELEEWLLDTLKEWQKDLQPGQKLAVSGSVSAEECDATINLVDTSRKRRTPIDRLLSQEELDRIGAVRDFNVIQRTVVDLFLATHNQPKTRRAMKSYRSQIEQINGKLRNKGLAYGLYYLHAGPTKERGIDEWTDTICFRALK